MPEIRLKLPHEWSPRPYQKKLWDYLSNGGKRAVENWHRRSGKDDIFLHHTSCSSQERKGNYWYLLPEYAQARKSMWDAVNPKTGRRRIDDAFPNEMRATTKDQEMMIPFKNGSTFQLVGADNFNSLVGSPPVGLVFSEYSRTNPSAWAYLMPIMEENEGWVGFNSTPKGNNHFKRLCEFAAAEPGWHYQMLTADETNIYTKEQLQSILRQLQSTHGDDFGMALWLQEYYCSFDAAIPGSIWGDCVKRAELEGRICLFEIDTKVLVDTGWDLGRVDDTSIWFRQFNGPSIDIVDHHSSSLKDVDFYVNLLLDKIKQHGWKYGTHWLPHDARPRTLAAGGGSILQQFQAAAKSNPELGRFAIIPRLDVQEGIQAARKTFPRCRFHASRCEKGLESLKQYHREWDDEKKVFLDSPEHDWSSHDADAWRYLSLSWKFKSPTQPEAGFVPLAGNPVGQTFGVLKNKHLARKRAERTLATR